MRSLHYLVAVLWAAFMIACAEEPVPKPNVILIVIDTLRANHMTDYGYGLQTDVTLDDFKSHSTLFSNCYSPAPWTVPSVASLFTGLFTARHGTNSLGDKLPEEAITLSELLKENGWQTLGYSFNSAVSAKTRFDQGFKRWEERGRGALTYYPDISEMFSQVEKWLDGGPTEPFFLYLQPMNCHGPYRTPDTYLDHLLGRSPRQEFRYQGKVMQAVQENQDHSAVTEGYITSLIEQYDTAIWYSTYKISAFFNQLRSRGLYDDSLIIVTSDHGEELYDHGGFSHGFNLYEEVLHIPLYIKLPRQRKGATISKQVSLTDIYPTLVEILGLDTDHLLDGRSLVPYLDGNQNEGEAASLVTRLHQTDWEQRCEGRAIVSGNYKLIEIERDRISDKRKTLLFDLGLDPAEKQNLAAEKPEVVRRLQRTLDDRFAHYENLALSASENVLDQMDTERLKALGYLD